MASTKQYSLVILVVVLVAILVVVPLLKELFPAVFPYEGFRDVDCAGVTCEEGQFCKDNKCASSETSEPSEPV